ncbi:PH domain-containing protein [Mongoliitalea lutea]|uniref:YdbS-like PH domain-containing protein n=1 Tax=Mongoliitalea lutea TaxID=849756 RepID=A0A8J3D1E6_9BACT|nr:PH domain-containing protein [Mongoliitalea lutea]GHB49225.1 hypothetical protein GCM10008106_32540 [Mongoliitalea lutea]
MNNPPILKPSQWINFGYILFGLIGSPLVIPFLIMVYKILDVYFWRFEVYGEYVIERRGVFTVNRRELYYFRVKAIQHNAPFLYRIVGISNVNVISSDPYSNHFEFKAIRQGLEFSNALRKLVQHGRKKNKIRELDFYNL